MNKPNKFQIKIANKLEWQRAWDVLSKHYIVSTNADECKYSRGCIIKVGTNPQTLWTSIMGFTPGYTTYQNWDEFVADFNESFKEKERPTFNHCAELVSLDQDMAIMQIEIADQEERLKKLKETYQNYLTRTTELNIILGINE